ncbi:endonuclease III domain-containing protein [Staphylococcus durrellii]|uniref:endonuclease III domain-containing protein n=1 Tax=Staphylococcus durrellii TaxID=2781773 RepID=UPI0018A0E99B|nr:endonuclease III domain-containing protein [Staphylococcus durrellii]MBF7017767.1 endonuclease III domain-containing protein [Staphylococcus durrellii]
MLNVTELYHILYKHMGAQQWWPARTKIEIVLGAILVQNTNWRNAALAIEKLEQHTQLAPDSILQLSDEALQEIIKSSGFFRAKAQTIKSVLTWMAQFDFEYEKIKTYYQDELRTNLLAIKGIGNETTDVLLVYIFEVPVFIPDSYTRRIFYKLGYNVTNNYEQLGKQVSLPANFTAQDANEFHALLDNFGKQYFNKKEQQKLQFLESYFIR